MALLLRGIIALILGVELLIWPLLTLGVLIWLSAAFAVVYGAIAIAAAIATRETNKSWGLMLTLGIIGIIIGFMAFFWTNVFSLALLILIAIWLIVSGFVEIILGLMDISHGWPMLVFGIISVIFGFVILAWPEGSAVALAWLIGFFLIFLGVWLLAASSIVPKEGAPVAA